MDKGDATFLFGLLGLGFGVIAGFLYGTVKLLEDILEAIAQAGVGG